MAAEIITKEDLVEFENRLLEKIRSILGQATQQPLKWFRKRTGAQTIEHITQYTHRYAGEWFDQVHAGRRHHVLQPRRHRTNAYRQIRAMKQMKAMARFMTRAAKNTGVTYAHQFVSRLVLELEATWIL